MRVGFRPRAREDRYFQRRKDGRVNRKTERPDRHHSAVAGLDPVPRDSRGFDLHSRLRPARADRSQRQGATASTYHCHCAPRQLLAAPATDQMRPPAGRSGCPPRNRISWKHLEKKVQTQPRCPFTTAHRQDADPEFSLCDAASIVLMREQGITRIFTFDQHFVGSGFDLVP